MWHCDLSGEVGGGAAANDGRGREMEFCFAIWREETMRVGDDQ